MNERIKELHDKVLAESENMRWNIEDAEKFAELIVKECASIYDKIDNGNLHQGTDNYLEALQRHFGIES